MSEFTRGILFLNENMSSMKEAVKTIGQDYRLTKLNGKWGVLFPKEFGVYVDDPMEQWYIEASRKLPILLFVDSEDHGWQFSIYADGEEKAFLAVSYEIQNQMYVALAEYLYPNRNPWVGELHGENGVPAPMARQLFVLVENSDRYKDAVAEQYEDIGLEHLAIFGVSGESIHELEATLSAENYHDYAKRALHPYEFKKSLGITEMNWRSYRYEVRDEK